MLVSKTEAEAIPGVARQIELQYPERYVLITYATCHTL